MLTRRRIVQVLGVLALATLVVAACTKHDESSSQKVVTIKLPENWWNQTWKATDGNTISMVRLKGKPLVVNLWASWCAACVRELPRINEMAAKNLANQAHIVGLAVESNKQLRQFLRRNSLLSWHYPLAAVGMEHGMKMATDFSGDAGFGLPLTIFFDSKGMIFQRIQGALSDQDLAAIEQLP